MRYQIKIVLSLLLLSSCSILRQEQTEPFVTVKGTQFFIGSSPYRFAGTNMWYGAYLGMEGSFGDRTRLLNELDILAAHGIKNLRILAASESAMHNKSLKPAFQEKAGLFNEELAIGLDFFLAEMGKRGMKAVVFLNNYWEWSGGMSVYNEWTGKGPMVDPALGDWRGFMNYSASFYENQTGQDLFRAYVAKIINRKNTFTGKIYRDDPTIMAWQLANEPRPGTDDASGEQLTAYVNWIETTAAFIKSIDKNHLVSTGSEGLIGSAMSDSVYLNAHDSPSIDYATIHLWAKNWGWFKKDSVEATFPVTLQKASEYIQTHIDFARQLKKPLVLEEFGLGRDEEMTDPQLPASYRNAYFQFIFSIVEEGLKTNSPLQGTNFWAWGGFGKTPRKNAIWQPGDPFMGDPPQEPQGLNSVFASDSETLQLIKRHYDHLTSNPENTKK